VYLLTYSLVYLSLGVRSPWDHGLRCYPEQALSLEEKIAMEKAAKANFGKRTDLDNLEVPGTPRSVVDQIARKAGVSPRPYLMATVRRIDLSSSRNSIKRLI